MADLDAIDKQYGYGQYAGSSGGSTAAPSSQPKTAADIFGYSSQQPAQPQEPQAKDESWWQKTGDFFGNTILGALKGAGQTALSAVRDTANVAAQGVAAAVSPDVTKAQESRGQLADVTMKMIRQIRGMDDSNPHKAELMKIVQDNQKTLSEQGVNLAGILDENKGVTDPLAVNTAHDAMKPKGAGQNIGYYGEKIAEFLYSGKALQPASEAVVTKTVDTAMTNLRELGTAGEKIAEGLSEVAGKNPKLVSTLLKSISGAATGYIQGMDFSGGTDPNNPQSRLDNAETMAKWGAAIPLAQSALMGLGKKLYGANMSVNKEAAKQLGYSVDELKNIGLENKVWLKSGMKGLDKTLEDLSSQYDDLISAEAKNGTSVGTKPIMNWWNGLRNEMLSTHPGDTLTEEAVYQVDMRLRDLAKEFPNGIPIDQAKNMGNAFSGIVERWMGNVANFADDGTPLFGNMGAAEAEAQSVAQGTKAGIRASNPNIKALDNSITTLRNFSKMVSDKSLNGGYARAGVSGSGRGFVSAGLGWLWDKAEALGSGAGMTIYHGGKTIELPVKVIVQALQDKFGK